METQLSEIPGFWESPQTSMSACGDSRRDGVGCMGSGYTAAAAAAAGGLGDARTEGRIHFRDEGDAVLRCPCPIPRFPLQSGSFPFCLLEFLLLHFLPVSLCAGLKGDAEQLAVVRWKC